MARHEGMGIGRFLERPYAATILGGIGVPAVAAGFLSLIGTQGVQVEVARAESIPFAEEVGARALWVVSATALATGMVGIVLLCRGVIRRHGGHGWARRTWWWAGAAGAAALAFSILDSKFGLRLSWGALAALPTRVPMREFFHVFNAAGAVPTVFVVSAVAATQNGEWSAERGADLRVLLNSIGVVLAVAVVEIFALHNWTHACVGEADKPAVRAVSVALSGGLGGMYSIFLAAVFAPAFLREGRRSAGEALAPWTETARRVGAVLVPVLTGGAIPAVMEGLSRVWG